MNSRGGSEAYEWSDGMLNGEDLKAERRGKDAGDEKRGISRGFSGGFACGPRRLQWERLDHERTHGRVVWMYHEGMKLGTQNGRLLVRLFAVREESVTTEGFICGKRQANDIGSAMCKWVCSIELEIIRI
jgi:hypothetical protein